MAYDEIDKSSHVDIIKNPEVKEFLSNCDFMVLPTGKELENVVSNFVEIPATSRKLPGKVLAIDCSNYESSIYSHLPYTRVGYVKLSNLLVDRTIYKGLTAKRFIDPFKVAQFSQDNTAMTFTLPMLPSSSTTVEPNTTSSLPSLSASHTDNEWSPLP